MVFPLVRENAGHASGLQMSLTTLCARISVSKTMFSYANAPRAGRLLCKNAPECMAQKKTLAGGRKIRYNITAISHAGVSEWQTMRTQNPLVATPCGFKSHRRHHMNEPHFSNCFIEKRGSSYVESLVTRGFPLFVAPDLFFKISQMQKQYFYIGLKFRQYFPIKQACKHLQMPVMSYNSAFGEAALHYRTEYAPLPFCRNVVQRYSPSGRLPLS